MRISKALRKHFYKSFGEENGDRAIVKIEKAVLPLIGDNFKRVVYAIILGSKGDFQEYCKYLEHAKIDWRDILLTTGLADSNWKEVLKKNGIKY